MKCFIGIEKKLEDNTMFYREPVKIDKDWSDMIRFFCSRNKSGGLIASGLIASLVCVIQCFRIIMMISFVFHGPPFHTFKTDRLDLRGLDPGKSNVKGSLYSLLYMQNASLKV